MRTLLLLIGLAVLSGVSARPAAADPRSDAKAHYLKGKALFDAKDYANAIAEFKAADALAPSGVNDYNIALAYDALGDAAQATTYYKSYLARVPAAANKAEVEGHLKRLSTKVADDAEKKRLAEEEAKRLAEERRQPPPVDDPPPPQDPPSSTGDPELDRVAAVDVGAVRDQRAQMGFVGTAGPSGGPPPPDGGAGPAPAPVEEPKKAKPIYKQWWFWVVAGVSAYVLISILASDSDSQPGARAIQLDRPIAPMPDGFGSGGGASLFRF